MADSAAASAAYTVLQLVATPVLSPATGTYLSSITVTITDSTAGASIYYTTNGSAPTTASIRYAGPIVVAQTTTINAMAAAAGMADSGVVSATYTIQPPVAVPVLSPASGTFSAPVTVTITDKTPGATIHYTADGSTPTASSTSYTGPISVTRTTTIRAMAAASGMTDSGVASASYTLQAAAPTFNPPGGRYLLGPLTVSISSASPGVTIYYTTNGSTPTTSSNRYSGPLLIILGTTVKAIAVRDGWSQSSVGSATYSNLLGL
jgi:hypothetical protein